MIKAIKIPIGLSDQELMTIFESIEDQFKCELIRVYPDKAIFEYFD